MRVLFDQGTPAPLRHALPDHEVRTAFEMGWSTISNGELLRSAEQHFDVFITTDKNLQHQQNLDERQLGIVVLPTTSWPVLQAHLAILVEAIASIQPGQLIEVILPSRPPHKDPQ